MQQLLERIPGTTVFIDDILIWGKTKQEHDERLRMVLDIARENNLKLNKTKCQFGKTSIQCLGEQLTGDGVLSDMKKIKAITEMPQPDNKQDIQHLLGM
ncbi:Hypothetical predicted protein, partial [Pelobates cultripes]